MTDHTNDSDPLFSGDMAELEIKTLQDLDEVIKKLKDIQSRLKKVVGEVPGEK